MTSEPRAALLVAPADLKSLREALCMAQRALPMWAEEWAIEREEAAVAASERLGGLIAEIDRHRPLGPRGKHGDLHTPTCGCDTV